MRIIKGRNVNDLWASGLLALMQEGAQEQTRAGKALVMPTPVMSVYERPYERVLLDPVRDANPFFHLMESLWMLAGRDDAAFLDRYVGDFGKRFGDGPDEARYIHGAYGKRWRSGFGFDQLDAVVRKLRNNPSDRQCVIQMWDSTLYNSESYGFDDLTADWRDRPCNTHVYLRVRSEAMRDYGGGPPGPGPASHNVLDLTVCCRSNDIVFGAYGANAVHFSVLQEYLAGRIGVGIGKMYQFSNNMHGYLAVLEKQGDPLLMSVQPEPYASDEIRSISIGKNWDCWDDDLNRFMRWHDEEMGNLPGRDVYTPLSECANSWFQHVAAPMAVANWEWKNGMKYAALETAKKIDALDWCVAAVNWMTRRMKT